MNTQSTHREAVPPMPNRLGLAGIEFIEYATSRPQALGQVLEKMGFRPIARHRSREVTLYRQGEMNIVVNAHPEDARVTATADGQPVISAVAFRVHDALKAYTQCMDLGAWHVDSHAQAMELHIPAIHGPGGSRFYFVDRWQEFSIYDIDFKAIPAVDLHPPAIAGMNFFGVVQYIGESRSADWIAYYQHMFDLQVVPDNLRFGIMPKGKLLKSPCGSFLWQLIEPDPSMDADESIEYLQRIGLGTPHVAQAIIELKKRGVNFVESSELHPEDRGALTQSVLGSVLFELVHQDK